MADYLRLNETSDSFQIASDDRQGKAGLPGFFFSHRLRKPTFPTTMHNQTHAAFLGALFLGALLPRGLAGGVELKPGQPFPELVLPKLADGQPGTISEFRGKKLILHLFASW
ncbi:MAG: TlpA family protein disulfide reductase [Limisphaerales bacterium]